MTKDKRFVLITTDHNQKGVFVGYLIKDKSPSTITLENARNVIYWDREVRGVFGLAALGPNSKCRIGPSVPRVQLYYVTSITDISKEAAKKWKEIP